MRLLSPLRLHPRRGLLVYQLVLILIAIIILILVLLYFARHNQIGTTAPAADTTAAASAPHWPAPMASGQRLAT
ncbi:MAG TPA: hypothetical protein VIR34_05520 [Gemmatimonadaceae bacterium]|jgi:hypothetical protein